jgi:hypothetical protein
LALVIYRPKDLPTNAVCLESNFVLPMEDCDLRVGDRKVSLKKNSRIVVSRGEVVSFHRGAAVGALRVLWSATTGGQPASILLVNDGNDYGAARLVIQHADASTLKFEEKVNPGAVIWAAIGTGLRSEQEVQRWLAQFSSAKASVTSSADALHAEAAAEGRNLAVQANAPWIAPKKLHPAPGEAVLELDGQDLSAAILKAN